MIRISLVRTQTGDEGTLGVLGVDHLVFQSGELPWRGNKPKVSCIPAGIYQVRWEFSQRFQRSLYEIKEVPERDECKFHAANFMGDELKGFRSELNGCIALGMSVGKLREQKALLSSRAAMNLFEGHLRGKPFELELRWAEGINPEASA